MKAVSLSVAAGEGYSLHDLIVAWFGSADPVSFVRATVVTIFCSVVASVRRNGLIDGFATGHHNRANAMEEMNAKRTMMMMMMMVQL